MGKVIFIGIVIVALLMGMCNQVGNVTAVTDSRISGTLTFFGIREHTKNFSMRDISGLIFLYSLSRRIKRF